ncbi:hypothetical protein FXO38_24923 [Capsicum annuum]|uniref:Protein TolB n=1 Tax=Capsicum annuum TaxID=4072 RepID=A0A1U8GEG2_CAPAN|nr:uncharacterized protein LOC107867802 [Capsicum annuum]KAF3632820.1 hypothetical protein FXO37_27295 [Capsicum annuum]KAF3634875.1 hypothetical protein FXO38_24923 [Capsicum annuum]PHT83753.1 hypothetical protein T459_12196 [Capsicum annuum]
MKSKQYLYLFIFFFLLSLIPSPTTSAAHGTSIIFTTLGRSTYSFDIFALPTTHPPTESNELQLTDGNSINFNGHFPASLPPSLLSRLPDNFLNSGKPPFHLIYVTERNGTHHIFYDAVFHGTSRSIGERRAILEFPTRRESTTRVQVSLVGAPDKQVSLKDKPSLSGESLIYVSTHEDSGVPRTSWAAVYSTHLVSGLTRRLTPKGVADFSPVVSPSGVWTAVASYGMKGWSGEVEELATDIYVFLTRDGSGRVKVVDHGGWPTWADDYTLYFHRRCDDGWWSVFKAVLPKAFQLGVGSLSLERVTPPGLHVFTPAASTVNKNLIAVATRRAGSEYRHIELFNVDSMKFTEITRPVSPHAHHLNPFFSPDSSWVGYHKCRGAGNGRGSDTLLLENLLNPIPGISLFRIDGSFPSFSPNGDRIAYVRLPGLYVVNYDGSGLRQISSRTAFSTAWDPKRKGVIYTSIGPTFASESTEVDVISINVDDEDLSHKQLTIGGQNNAFPSPSPDGKWIVFRSGRTGHKNLYIMDALEGEAGGLRRLTEGPWTDTMCNWSPDGEWIAFASDRANPGSGSFEMYMIHPNGTGIKKVIQSGTGGRTNHPYFSPDGKYIVFTSDYAAVSAEPISNPHHYQPYGDIYVIKSDGSEIQRLTHNSYEDGTPAWGPTFIKPVDVEWPNGGHPCSFEDCHWLNVKPNASLTDVSFGLGSTKIECGQ